MLRLVALLLTLIKASSSDVAPIAETYPVEGRLKFPPGRKYQGLPFPTTELSLNGGEHRAYSRPDGRFVFHEVPAGVYLLDVLSVEFVFSQVKLSLPEDPREAIRCLEYKYPGAPKAALAYPVELTPHLRYEYFEQREQPGLHTLFRNPMLLMLLFTCGMVVFMPKLMDAMDPEERAQMQKQMAGAQDPASMLKRMMGMENEDDSDDEEPAKKIKGK
mmetsp:Transcript_25634/g.76966  ORF Transcript_25634/g.76966 Transcript_25634/m.76966 type:complete len:217 (-) Transcript_25634:29-679(-)